MLYVVGTPIGNPDDFSSRAKDILSSVDLIACEDTRTTALFLSKFSIRNHLISYHDHNRAKRNVELVSMLREGKDIALVSDAGMPCISDPGEELVRICHEQNISVTVIPGPVAAMSAIAVSGLDSRRFFFEGFLPASGKERKERLKKLSEIEYTFVLYEAPHRIVRTLKDLKDEELGNRRLTVCRELTKKYEEILFVTVEEALAYYEKKEPKGEFVLVLEGKTDIEKKEAFRSLSEKEKFEIINQMKESGMSTRDISRVISKEWMISSKDAYQLVLQMK